MTEDSKNTMCSSCLYRDARPEVGVGDRLVYCMKKDRVVSPKLQCDLYSRSTEKTREQLRHSLYGTFNEDEEG